MSEAKAGALDYVLLTLILLVSVIIGLYQGYKNRIDSLIARLFKRNKAQDIELKEIDESESGGQKNGQVSEYLTANASMGAIPIAFSLVASFFSSNSILGLPAEVYQYGIQYLAFSFGLAVTPILGAFFTGPFFANLNIVSIFEYIEMRYKKKSVRLVGMVLYAIRNFLSSSLYILGPSTVLSLFFGIDPNISIAMMFLIGTSYTVIGGIKAVIWTDLFQAVITYISLFTILGKGIYDIGLSEIFDISSAGGRLNLFDFNPDPFIRQSFWNLVPGTVLSSTITYCFDQQALQRFKAAKSKKQAQVAFLLNVPGSLLYLSLCCLMGLVVYAYNYQCDPLYMGYIQNANQYISYLVLNRFYVVPGFIGIFVAGIFCSALSSLSSYQNSLAAIIWEDFFLMFNYFKKLNDSKSLTMNKIIVMVSSTACLCFTYIIALSASNLVQLSNTLAATFNGPLLGLFVMSVFFSCANHIGALTGIGCGLVASLVLSIGAFIVQPVYERLDVSIESCFNESNLFNVTNASHIINFDHLITSQDGPVKFFHLSIMWYTMYGALVTLIIGLVVSLLTGGHKNQIDDSLILYDLSKCLKKTNNLTK